MNVRLALASLYVPAFVRRRKLAELVRRAADAFGAVPPDVRDQTLPERLRTFAAFTNEEAELACRDARGDDDDAAVRSRLRATARDFAGAIGRDLGVKGRADAMRAARLLYRGLGIDFKAGADGTITIRRCYFADWYSPRVCALMSAMDEGVLSGLAGGGRLEFGVRITEGCRRCEATFHFDEAGA